VLQPLRWRCAECAVHHERNVREEQHHISGLPYWRIYRQIPENCRSLKVFGYKYVGLAIWRIFGDFVEIIRLQIFGLAKYAKVSFFVRYSLKMCSSVIYMHAQHICTYLVAYSYVGLLFLTSLIV